MIALIWAQANGGVIGADGTIPWNVPEDMAHFKELTSGATVVMGRKTWESLPPRFRPLPGRRNIVVTRNTDWRADGAEVVHTLDAALALSDDVWVIGGGEIYAAAMDRADRLEVTEIDFDVDGDAFAPVVDNYRRADVGEWQESSKDAVRYRFSSYSR